MHNGPTGEVISIVLLSAVLAFAVIRPRGLPEAVAAVPAAGLVLLLGLASPAEVWARVLQLLPTVAFLAAILVLAHLADSEGVFDWLGSRLAVAANGNPRRLLVFTFAAAAGTTAVLSLDATVVLLTPVVFATASTLRVRAKPHVYACTHLANSASTLLPVSNLTNLLAFGATGLSFLSFTGLMVLPWVVSIGIELGVFLWFFAGDLGGVGVVEAERQEKQEKQAPVFALAVLGAVLVGFGLTSLVGLAPVWVAAAGAVVLAVRGIAAKRVRVRAVVVEAAPLFLLFVLGLAVVVQAVAAGGLGRGLAAIVPGSAGLVGLLAAAGIAAVLANVVNNLPAVLVLLPALGAHPAPGIVLAVLLGVNLGPNLSYVGSLATLLWRRILAGRGMVPTLREFVRLGALTVPASLVASVLALWVGLLVAGSTG